MGPSLNVSSPLADPTLEVHGPNGSPIINDNWRDTQEAEIIATGIPPTNDAESAIIRTLNPGNYTAIIAGKNGGTGIGVIEVYDVDNTVEPKLGNIATRGFVQTGDNVLIGGFIVGGGAGVNTRVLVRGIGPSLGALVPTPLADPTLELHDGNGALLMSNDNWKSDQRTAIAATGLAPTNDAESAILAPAAPGNYTAILRGANNTLGTAVVEIYDLGP